MRAVTVRSKRQVSVNVDYIYSNPGTPTPNVGIAASRFSGQAALIPTDQLATSH